MSDNEWYTPSKYIEAARAVMGSIDLDPASCALANETVKATSYYTKEQDGLQQDWYGNVWLNPPYSNEQSPSGIMVPKRKSQSSAFLAKLINHYQDNNIVQAILCINADVSRNWFLPLWDYTICFSNKKFAFNRPGKTTQHHFFGTAFVYLGPYEQRFTEIFSQFGTIVKRVV